MARAEVEHLGIGCALPRNHQSNSPNAERGTADRGAGEDDELREPSVAGRRGARERRVNTIALAPTSEREAQRQRPLPQPGSS